MRSLVSEIRLQKEEPPAAAVGSARGTVETLALCWQTTSWPQLTLVDDDLHPLEPIWHHKVVGGEIEWLAFAIQKSAITDVWPIGPMRPVCFRICTRNCLSQKTGLRGKGKMNARLGIFRANSPSGAHFR